MKSLAALLRRRRRGTGAEQWNGTDVLLLEGGTDKLLLEGGTDAIILEGTK